MWTTYIRSIGKLDPEQLPDGALANGASSENSEELSKDHELQGVLCHYGHMYNMEKC